MQEELSRPQPEVQYPPSEKKFGTGFFEINTHTSVSEPLPPAPLTVETSRPIPPVIEALRPMFAAVETLRSTPAVVEALRSAPAVVEPPPAVATPVPKTGNETAVLLTNADILYKHGETTLAAHLLRKCLYLNSHHPEALKRLANCMTQEKQLPLKTKVYEALVQSDLCFENMARLGHCLYQQNQDERAKQIYMEAMSLMTGESVELFEVFKNMGNIAMREGDFDGAEELYNKAFTLNPESDVLHINLGTLALQQQEKNLAVTRFRTALEINPRNDKAWVGLALVHNEMGDHVLSRANLENALDINSRNRTAVHLAASWAVRDQDYQFAIESLENFVSDVDCDEEMSLLLIHLFCMRNQFVEARLELERLLLWEPTNERLLQVEQEIRNAQNG